MLQKFSRRDGDVLAVAIRAWRAIDQKFRTARPAKWSAPQSSSASRFTAAQAGFFISSQSMICRCDHLAGHTLLRCCTCSVLRVTHVLRRSSGNQAYLEAVNLPEKYSSMSARVRQSSSARIEIIFSFLRPPRGDFGI